MIQVRKLSEMNKAGCALAISALCFFAPPSFAQTEIEQDAIMTDIETLKESPQRLWAKPIVFKDTFKSKPDGRVVKINDEKYTRFRTKELGEAYATADMVRELRNTDTDNELIFHGTVLNRRGDFYVIVNKVLDSNSNPAAPISSLVEYLGIDEDLLQHQGHLALKNLLDVAQADMLVYSRKNDVPFRELFNPDSTHAEAPLNIIRDAIRPLRNAEQMRPDELLAQVINLALEQHYTSGGAVEPNINIPEELLETARARADAPAGSIAAENLPAVPKLRTPDAVASEKPANTDPALAATDTTDKAPANEKVGEDLDELIAKLGREQVKEPLIIGEPRAPDLNVAQAKPDPEANRALMQELEGLDEAAAKPAISMTREGPAPSDDNESLLDDIENALAENDDSPEAPPAPAPVAESGDDELDKLMKSVANNEPANASPPVVAATQPAGAIDPNAPAGAINPNAPAGVVNPNAPAGVRAAQPVQAAKPKSRGGLFGIFGKNDTPKEPKPEVIEIASNTRGNIRPADPSASTGTAEATTTAQKTTDDFEFQFSPIPRYKN